MRIPCAATRMQMQMRMRMLTATWTWTRRARLMSTRTGEVDADGEPDEDDDDGAGRMTRRKTCFNSSGIPLSISVPISFQESECSLCQNAWRSALAPSCAAALCSLPSLHRSFAQ